MTEPTPPQTGAPAAPLLAVARQCQDLARGLAAVQNRTSALAITPNRATQLAVVLRTAQGPVTLTEQERAVLCDLLELAGQSAVALPATHKTAVSVTALVNALLSAGNLLEEALTGPKGET